MIWLISLWGILIREGLRFMGQKERMVSALLRPMLWLVIFAAGFRAALGVAITPPYDSYITYEVYILPGLVGMVQLFNGMQTSLSMVYDRETGSMRVLLTSPLPRWWLLACKLIAGALVSLVQVYVFLLAALAFGVEVPALGYVAALPVLFLTGLMLGAAGLFLSSAIRQLENFAGVMNFVIFPAFFLSSALYPLWKVAESSPLLAHLAQFNPFTHAVEAIRFALYLDVSPSSLAWVLGSLAVFSALAVWGYDPSRGFLARRVME
ncbi:ABC transporter permease protein [Paramagnetospirillum magnetotacticum MS-1]|uniref:Transport permease protein n=1 Tax=Paramagnetospirillum magnetotacticum MS-1 TaxID=272627 RepID=A0A0C2YWJ2_PARME|nr:ABC transporter permease [Paramagnetospirillum magnetotacticum]KIL99493.1 ABC transporter permease protein [Paramagnetospirillum magnetotacticum MS-1]